VDFALSPEQTLLRDAVRGYCRDHYAFPARMASLRGAEGFSREHWAAYAELGWLGAAMPEALGGTGGSAIELALILEELGRVAALEPFVPCAVLAGQAMLGAGREAQRHRVLTPLIEGRLMLACAHAETAARGVTAFVETRAHRTVGGYHLSGHKTFVPGGGSADAFLISARTAGDGLDREGVSLFLVRADTPGLVRRRFRTLDGGQAAELTFRDLSVDADALVGLEGQALDPIEDAIDLAMVCVCAEAVGSMAGVVTTTRDYLKTRRAYGTTLSTFQALQHRLADMLVELELSRSMMYRVLAAMRDVDRRARRVAVSAAKALIGRGGRFVGASGIQLHGAMGVSDDCVISHYFKRLTAIEALFGSSDFHLRQIVCPDDQTTRDNAAALSAMTS
jgi:alkylation response protein AidB-like acyl-CoA dehydrogenase